MGTPGELIPLHGELAGIKFIYPGALASNRIRTGMDSGRGTSGPLIRSQMCSYCALTGTSSMRMQTRWIGSWSHLADLDDDGNSRYTLDEVEDWIRANTKKIDIFSVLA